VEYEVSLSGFGRRYQGALPNFADANLRCRRCANIVGRREQGSYSYAHPYPPKLALADLVKRLKGRSSRLLQAEFPKLKERYWRNHFWAIGYGAWSTGNITDEMAQEYLEHHRNPSNKDNDSFILE
jgi:Transposase IS200 like